MRQQATIPLDELRRPPAIIRAVALVTGVFAGACSAVQVVAYVHYRTLTGPWPVPAWVPEAVLKHHSGLMPVWQAGLVGGAVLGALACGAFPSRLAARLIRGHR